MRSVKDNAHDDTGKGTSDRDGHDPGEDEQADTLPVDGLDGAVHETDTDGSTGDTHGGGDGQGELGEDEDGDGGAHLHRATTAGRVVGDLVAHDAHDVVSVGDETDAEDDGDDGELPGVDGGLGGLSAAGGPGLVDDGPRTDSVTDVVGTVGERGSAGSEDLDERVGVLDLVGVLGGVGVDTSHAVTLGGSLKTRLSGVDVVVSTVESTSNNLGGETLGGDLHVVELVDTARTHWGVAESAHGPTHGAGAKAELSVETGVGFGTELLVGLLGSVNHGEVLLGVLAGLDSGGTGTGLLAFVVEGVG